MTDERLLELQAAGLPFATCELIGLTVRPVEGASPEAISEAADIIQRTDVYLSLFTPGRKDGIVRCPQCGAELAGLIGSFTWGLQSGEGFCARCNYPVRAHHRTDDFELFESLLPYHPSVVRRETVEGVMR